MTAVPLSSPTMRLRRAISAVQPYLLATIALVFVVVGLNDPTFLSGPNLGNLLNSMSFVGFVIIGQTVLLLTGEFDLSVGAVSGLSAVASALVMENLGAPVVVGVLSCLVVGSLAGLINGLVVERLGVPSFIATFGMASFASGIALYLSRGEPIPMPEAIREFGAFRILPGQLGLSGMFVVFVVIAIVVGLLLRYTAVGRMVYATGGDRAAARAAGIPTGAVKIAGFTLTGLLAAIAGLLQAGEQSIALSTTGSSGVELLAVAAALVGGVSIFGGAGTILGAFVGLLLLTSVKLGIVSMGIPINWQSMAVGVIIIGAIALDFLLRGSSTAIRGGVVANLLDSFRRLSGIKSVDDRGSQSAAQPEPGPDGDSKLHVGRRESENHER